MNGLDLQSFVLEGLALLPGLVLGFTVHELAHALVAYALGDRGEHTRSRLTLNPLRHISWLGLAAFMLIRIGWAKPVRFDPHAFKHPNLDSFLVAVAGAGANFLTALLWGLVLLALAFAAGLVLVLNGISVNQVEAWLKDPAYLPWVTVAGAFTFNVVWVNLVLACFNLLPFPGLDGFHALLRLYLMLRGLLRPGAPPLPWFEAATAADSPAPGPAATTPTTPAEWLAQGAEYQRTGLLREAIGAYRGALRLDPALLDAYWGLARTYRMLGERRQAIAALGAALSRTTDPAVRGDLTAAMRDLGWQPNDPVPALEPPLTVS